MKGEVRNFTKNDFLIICSGANDIARNDSKNAFKNIINFIKNVNHTNIVSISISFRHDILEYHYVNSLTIFFNSKLHTLARAFSHVSITQIINDRLLLTKCGSHLNKLGKELLVNQVAIHIFSLLEKVNSKPIVLGWCDKETQVKVSLSVKPPQFLK
jgi:lysophospholipase L1-like esterase